MSALATALSLACQLGFCSCISPGTLAEAIADADAVIEVVPSAVRDTALAVDSSVAGPRNSRYRIYTMLVQRRWKGVKRDSVQIMTGTGGGDCGYRFEVGVRYVVFARQGAKYLGTSICSRTKPAAELSKGELAALGRIP